MRSEQSTAAALKRLTGAFLLPLVFLAVTHVPARAAAQSPRGSTKATAPTARTPISAIACASGAPPVAAARVAWRKEHDGVRWGEWPIQVGDVKLPIRIIVAEIDPTRIHLSLELKHEGSRMVSWSIDDAPPTARIALNAGQFTDDGPWGWVVHRGREWQAPGSGPLAGALVVDSAGGVQLLDASDISFVRERVALREAVQSYPTLLSAGGVPPAPLCADELGIDRGHRDTRLAVGTALGGKVIVALSRFDGLGSPVERFPLGPTTPEMANIMKALGATRALMLDGGLSAQLLVRDGDPAPHVWAGLRNVPLALIGVP